MNPLIARRHFLLAAAPLSLAGADAAEPAVLENFPSQPVTEVKEMVGVAHGNIARVRELLSTRPTLANATWDWGFGDWETALGAASHVGNREIAEVLLANGAYPTLFSAAMMGHVDVVKAMVAARPGVQRTAGPHSISLLAHARAGGEGAAEALRYLQSLGDAGGEAAVEITEEELAKFTGDYVFGAGPNDRVEITRKGKQLTFTRKGWTPTMIHHVGDGAFRPAGASRVRIRFEGGTVLTVTDGDLVVKARRVV